MKDTHYRNLFETRKGGGGTSTAARIEWEVGEGRDVHKNETMEMIYKPCVPIQGAGT